MLLPGRATGGAWLTGPAVRVLAMLMTLSLRDAAAAASLAGRSEKMSSLTIGIASCTLALPARLRPERERARSPVLTLLMRLPARDGGCTIGGKPWPRSAMAAV
jgi:hypothetical protein